MKDFELLAGKNLEGTIIRITKSGTTYYMGCRMHEDSKKINDYVEKYFRR